MSPTRITFIGYIDLFMVTCQFIVVMGTTIISLHWLDTYTNYWTNNEMRKNSWNLSPSLTWVGTGLVVLVDIGQVLTALHLLRAQNPAIRSVELGVITRDWLSWNQGSIFAGILWCAFFAIPLAVDNKWPLTFHLVFFMMHTAIRGILGYSVRKMCTQVYPVVVPHIVEREGLEMHNLEPESP